MKSGVHGWPTCAVCCRPVDSLTERYDPMRCEWVLTVECHGDRESVRMEDQLFEDGQGFRTGEAFVGKRMSA